MLALHIILSAFNPRVDKIHDNWYYVDLLSILWQMELGDMVDRVELRLALHLGLVSNFKLDRMVMTWELR